MRTELKAVVRSTLPEAWAEALTLEEGEVRKPVTGEACTGEADTETAVPTTSVNEADGMSGATSPKAASRARQHGGLDKQSGREAARPTASTCSRRGGGAAAP